MIQLDLSIIIPAYNCATYISTTLDSILSQKTTYTFELLVIDDGSTDNTSDILNKYESIHANIRVITIPNGGPANARNLGIQEAHGTYIGFVDSDDTILPGMIQHALDLAVGNQTDLVIWGFEIISQKTASRHAYNHPAFCSCSKSEFAPYFPTLYGHNQLNQIWNKLFRRSLLLDHGLKYPDYKYGEDRLFVYAVLQASNRICVTDACYYEYYIRNNGSLVTKYCPEKFEVCNLIDQQAKKFAKSLHLDSDEASNLLDYMYIKSVISCLTNLFETKNNLSILEKRTRIHTMLTNQQFQLALKTPVTTGGFSYKIIHAILQTRNITLTYILSTSIAKISKVAPRLFLKSKHFHNNKTK